MQDISFVLFGFFTGLSLIFAIGAQNIFVIEQGLKKQYVFLVVIQFDNMSPVFNG